MVGWRAVRQTGTKSRFMRYSILIPFLAALTVPAVAMEAQELQAWMQRSNGVYSLHEAAGAGNMEVLEARLREGADTNLRDENGATPLHLAAAAGHADAVEALLKAGADKTITDNAGKTPADVATGACAELLK